VLRPGDGHLVSDGAGTIREADAAASVLLGVAPKFVCGKPLAVFVTPATRRQFRLELLAVVRERSTHSFVVDLAPRDRPASAIEIVASAMPCNGGSSAPMVHWILRARRPAA
jgi:hypothetical protein